MPSEERARLRDAVVEAALERRRCFLRLVPDPLMIARPPTKEELAFTAAIAAFDAATDALLAFLEGENG